MECFAKTAKLTRILNSPKLIVRHYGKQRAQRIQARLDEFAAAQTLAQIPSEPPPRCHLLRGEFEGKFAVDISKNYRLIFEGYDKNDRLSADKNEIVTVQIIKIEDYH